MYTYVFSYLITFIYAHPQPDTLKQARRGKALQALETFFSAGLDDPDMIVRVLYICIYIYIYIHICIYVYMYIYIYIYTYIDR